MLTLTSLYRPPDAMMDGYIITVKYTSSELPNDNCMVTFTKSWNILDISDITSFETELSQQLT